MNSSVTGWRDDRASFAGLRNSMSGPSRTSAWVPALLGWVIARALVAISVALAHHLGPRAGYKGPSNLLFVWDGTFYRVLALHGYGGPPTDAARFFPLYPLLGRWLDAVLPGGIDAALLVVSNVFALVAGVALWHVVRSETDDPRLATRAVLIFSLFPASAALVMGYAESMLAAFVLLAALAIIADRPWLALAPLFLAGLTRPTGALLVIPVALLALGAWRRLRHHPVAPKPMLPTTVAAWWLAVAAPVAGAATYLLWLQATEHRGEAPLKLQNKLRAGFHEPLTRLAKMIYDVGTGHFRDVYNLGLVLVMIVAVVGAIWSRFSPAWTTYLVVGLLVALSANLVDSIGRYAVVLVPAWTVGLGWFARQRWVYALLLAGSAAGMVILTTQWMRGYVIP